MRGVGHFWRVVVVVMVLSFGVGCNSSSNAAAGNKASSAQKVAIGKAPRVYVQVYDVAQSPEQVEKMSQLLLAQLNKDIHGIQFVSTTHEADFMITVCPAVNRKLNQELNINYVMLSYTLLDFGLRTTAQNIMYKPVAELQQVAEHISNHFKSDMISKYAN